MTRSFRALLALRATGGVTLGMLAISAVTLFTLRALLDREVNSSILNVASIQAASLADGPGGEMHFHEWNLTPDEAASVRDLIRYAQVWDANGGSLLRSQYMTSDLPPDRGALSRASAGELVWVEQVFEGVPVRTVFYPLERLGPAHAAHVLQVAAPLTARNDMLTGAGAFLGLLTLLMAGATFAGSWWLADRAVRPIHEVIDQAEEIGARSLGRGIQAYADTIEYRRLVEVLNTMLDRLRGAFEAQRSFTSDASHELRSPLTAMRGEIELALRRERDGEEYRRVLESTLEEVVRLSSTAEDLLTLARSDAGVMQARREPVDLGELVGEVVQRLRPRADAKNIDVSVSDTRREAASVDPDLIRRAVWNLLDNALKFTPEGGKVCLGVGGDDRTLELVVDDTGPGLGGVARETLFRRFYRGDSVRTQATGAGGTGLGLAIVQAAADAHGGVAEAEERDSAGARFRVAIPLGPL